MAYNGWAKTAQKLNNTYTYWHPMSKGEELKLNLPPIPVGPPPGDVDYEFECPADSWIALVEACRIERLNDRKAMVQKLLFLAKNSHWTVRLYEEELHLLDAEWGGDTQPLDGEEEPAVSQAPSNPCATCGVDTGSDRMFCAKHDE